MDTGIMYRVSRHGRYQSVDICDMTQAELMCIFCTMDTEEISRTVFRAFANIKSDDPDPFDDVFDGEVF